MKEQWQVVDVTRNDVVKLKKTFDTEAEALDYIQKTPKDLMGTVILTIRKVWTNK